MDVADHYKKHGYHIVRDVLSASEVSTLRNEIERKFDTEQSRQVFGDVIQKDTSILKHFFNPKIVGAAKKIFGDDYKYIPDFLIQFNLFGAREDSYRLGWHNDSDSERGSEYLYKKKYGFAKLGIFLQSNQSKYGGGIVVVPKGHKTYELLSPKLNKFVKIVRDKLTRELYKEVLNIRAGDAVIFSSLLHHSSTLPALTEKVRQSPDILSRIEGLGENSKYVLYCNICNNESDVDFLDNSKERYCSRQHESEFFEYHDKSFPLDYPEEFVKLVNDRGVRVASRTPK
jgi:hypothetical protein